MQDQQLLPVSALRGEGPNAIHVERPVGQFVGDERADAACQVWVQRGSRPRLDLHARGHVGNIAVRVQGGILDEKRLPAVVILIRHYAASLHHLVNRSRQRCFQISQNVIAASPCELSEEGAASLVGDIPCNRRVPVALEAQAVAMDNQVDIFGEPFNEPESLG